MAMAVVANRTSNKKIETEMVAAGQIEQRILLIRGQRVILSADLARMYGVAVKRLNEQVKRNPNRFPDDFMFQLTRTESAALSKSQLVALNRRASNLKS